MYKRQEQHSKNIDDYFLRKGVPQHIIDSSMAQFDPLKESIKKGREKLEEMIRIQSQQESIMRFDPNFFKGKIFLNFKKQIEDAKSELAKKQHELKAGMDTYNQEQAEFLKIVGEDPHEIYGKLDDKYGSKVPIEAQLMELREIAKYVFPRLAGICLLYTSPSPRD